MEIVEVVEWKVVFRRGLNRFFKEEGQGREGEGGGVLVEKKENVLEIQRIERWTTTMLKRYCLTKPPSRHVPELEWNYGPFTITDTTWFSYSEIAIEREARENGTAP